MKIDLCISVPNGGVNFIELLTQTINKTKSGLHEITIRFTCHDLEQEKIIRDRCVGLQISGSHIVARCEKLFFHANSITHSRCIETMYQFTSADICLICDYDCIPIKQNWDDDIVRQINIEKVILVGSSYSELPTQLYGKIQAYKYQYQPNSIFLAINVVDYKLISPILCDFYQNYCDPISIPLKLISNPAEASQYGLAIGKFIQLDTGSRIPEVVAKNKIKTKVLERKVSNYKIISLNPAEFFPSLAPELLPEEYYLDGQPFAVHFRKASATSTKIKIYGIDQFREDIEKFLSKK